MFKIIKKEPLNPSMTRMVIEAPFVARKAMPGQFIILRVNETGERIPLTIADYDREAGTVTIIYQKVGKSTLLLDEQEAGGYLMDFIGPLGKASELEGYKKAAVLTDVANDYAVGLSNFFKKTFKKIGGELVADMKYSSGDQDFTAQLTELISKKPDIVFMPAYFAEGAIIMKQARELGATFVLMGGDAMDNPDTVKIAGKAAEGFMQTAFPYDMTMKDMNDQAKAFTEAWKKNFPNKDPNVNSALGYNCYNIILDALTRAGKADTEALTAALAATKNLPTALGVLSINETHDAEMPVGIIKYMDGKRKYIGDAIAE